jgi:saccharopine dehydrogenase-like NADP-dependent oxidoreductase
VKILVLGGCGLQGRAAVYDLCRSDDVREVVAADVRPDAWKPFPGSTGGTRVQTVPVNAADGESLGVLFQGVDAVIDLLPRQFVETVCRAAIRARVSVVNTNYAGAVAHLDEAARSAGVAIMPECGLDPGIDLVLYGRAARRFDELHVINSYCGGFPEKRACDNPLDYKISWTWEGVLSAANRDSRLVRAGEVVEIPGRHQHDEKWVHEVDFPGLGRLEAIPNGDALFFADLVGAAATVRETGRYSLRWPGWSAFWRPLKHFGFLSQTPVRGLPCEVTPVMLLDKLMGPRLAYREDEKDLVAMLNIFEGICGGQRLRLTTRLLVERDLHTGLMAMNQTVAFPAAIVARMIVRGDIADTGVLSPVRHVPDEAFLQALMRRGVVVEEEEAALPEHR